MPTYILLSNLTDEGAKALKSNPKRLQEVNKEIEKYGAKVTSQYAVLGPYDFVSGIDPIAHARRHPCGELYQDAENERVTVGETTVRDGKRR